MVWDGIKGHIDGTDRFGNSLSGFESSMKIVSAVPITKATSIVTSSATRSLSVGAGTKMATNGGAKVLNTSKQASEWLGKDFKTITNKAGDNIFMSKDGLRKMRFDIKNSHGDAPHIHLEIFKNSKWRDAIPGTHRIYPKK